MEFKSLTNIETSFRQIRLFALVFICLCALVTGFAVWNSYSFAEKQRQKIYVLDNGKSLMLALSQDMAQNRPVEAKSHVRRFHELFFTLSPDKGAIESNIKRSLFLADKTAFNYYKDLAEKGYYNRVIFEVHEIQSALGGLRKQVFDKNGEHYELREVFDAYIRFGGMPGIADVGLDQEKALSLLDGIYSTVVIRDILEREKRRGQKQITDPTLLRKIILFLADNIGSSVSISSIGNTLINEGLLDDGKRKGAPSAHTVQAYVNALLESYFFYEIKRFDIKGKAYLRTLGKYYIVDIGLRNYLLGFRNRDSGHAIENVVYFELLRRGYDVAIGKIGSAEVDFIATTADDKKYIQVTESMMSEDVRNRELTPLQNIRDNYEKIVLSLEPGLDASYDGIRSENLIDWLLSQ